MPHGLRKQLSPQKDEWHSGAMKILDARFFGEISRMQKRGVVIECGSFQREFGKRETRTALGEPADRVVE